MSAIVWIMGASPRPFSIQYLSIKDKNNQVTGYQIRGYLEGVTVGKYHGEEFVLSNE